LIKYIHTAWYFNNDGIFAVDLALAEGKDDIAVVHLKEAVSYGSSIQNIEFNTDSSYPPDGTICRAQGWGCTSNCNVTLSFN
jgi:hypothetical protein